MRYRALIRLALLINVYINSSGNVCAQQRTTGSQTLSGVTVKRTEEITYGDWTYYRGSATGGVQICGFETFTDDHSKRFAFTLSLGGPIRRAISTLSWNNRAWSMPRQSGAAIRVKFIKKIFATFNTIADGTSITAVNPFADDFGAEFVAELISPGSILVERNDDGWSSLSQSGKAEAVTAFVQCFQDRSRGR